ncbi:Branched-chain amino acid aminotransferase [Fulvivirga imtechensis AK7]|uniref:branched-chain-amino-acid transaminase n=1 Tax=Fulvivirga imtechensis AK7 TaxID=1237149 RepID=L8JQ90_9BACT|nr:aminotransferase class IV [Fulvivirga imtechensis]ELR70363.1 Branched-chain amino acid aminotransferase [Fulvivirga imtechensis AK7]
MFCFVNDDLLQVEEASIGIRDLSILRGYGIFDFFRVNDNVPIFLDDHIERFFASAEKVVDHISFDRDQILEKISTLINKNGVPLSGIRMVLTGGYSANAYNQGIANLIITQESIKFPDDLSYEKGVKVITHNYVRELPDVKTINYMTGIWMQREIMKQGAFDVLYHSGGRITELTRSNFFIVNDQDQLVTPGSGILKGITRKKVLGLASRVVEVLEKDILISDLHQAKEAFLTGTTKKVLPVTQVDEIIIGGGKPGETTRQLMDMFKGLERAYVRQYK